MIKQLRDLIPLGNTIALAFMCYFAYYLLLENTSLHTSITSIIAAAHHASVPRHLLILAFLPIYIASMIFGSALIGIYLGNAVPKLANRAAGQSRRLFLNVRKGPKIM